MRIRSIKPEFWESESLGRVSREARLLFIGLFSCCDDVGRARASSRLLASRLFPYDDDAFKKIPAWMSELQREGCIRIYQVDGESYLDIPKWLNHQKIDKPSASKLPPFETIREDSRGFEKNSLGTGNGNGNGNRELEQGTGNREGAVAPRSRFVPPTREELDLEAAKIGLPAIEVDKFVNYYGANGWRVGKSPMKSWTHALAGWSARFRERSTTTQSNDPIARRNALLGDDIAAHSAEATRRSQEIDRAHDLRYEQTGKTPFDP